MPIDCKVDVPALEIKKDQEHWKIQKEVAYKLGKLVFEKKLDKKCFNVFYIEQVAEEIKR
jgi:hypothetical protein